MFRSATPRWMATILMAVAVPAFSQAAPNQTDQTEKTSPVPVQPAAVPPANATPEEQGDALETQKRYQAAIEAYSKEPHPSAELWNKMGIAYQMMFNVRDAMRCYKQSLRLNSHNSSVYKNLGTVEASLRQYGAAEKMYRKALKLDPHSALILKNLGTNLLLRHKYKKGWQAYNQAMAINPQIFASTNGPHVENPTSVQERGAMNYYMALGCVRQGQTACALDYLRKALDEGFTTAKKVAEASEFATLRDNPEFKQLLAEQEQPKPQQK